MRQASSPLRLTRRNLLSTVGAIMATSSISYSAWSQQSTWTPTRPIKLIVPFPAGGGADVSARQVTEKLGQRLGQPVVIENRGGAGGTIGGEVASRAAPDGYTLLWATSEMIAAGPYLYARLPFKPLELVPVGPTGRIGFVLVGRSEFEPRTLPELIDLAQRREVSVASWGSGTAPHLGSETVKRHAKLSKLVLVPYQGAAAAVQAVVAGQVDTTFMPMPLWLVLNTKVNTIAVAAKSRYERLKQVPTMEDFGIPVDLEAWQGVYAPPNTPRPVVARISAVLAEVMADSDVRKKYESMGVQAPTETYEEFVKLLPADTARLGELMRLANVQPQ